MRNNVPYCTHDDMFLYEMHDPEGVDLTSNILSHIIKPFDRKKIKRQFKKESSCPIYRLLYAVRMYRYW